MFDFASHDTSHDWTTYTTALAQRFDREAEIQLGQAKWEMPEELQQLEFVRACRDRDFVASLGVPFHVLRKPKKREECLDIGCGVSFFLYPWTSWDAHFHGIDVSPKTIQLLQTRAPQLNSKLFKSARCKAAHQAFEETPADTYDLAIATGMLYYYPLDYFEMVWPDIQRVCKPKANWIVETVNPESPWAEEWGLVELEKGCEPLLTPLTEWEACVRKLGGRIRKQVAGELFVTYAIVLPG
ncbi:MAG: class I SAM-dependent methyltransferase [Cyanobacteria bacterium J06648_11]